MLTLQNIPKATEMAFTDYINGSDKKLKKLLSLLNVDGLSTALSNNASSNNGLNNTLNAKNPLNEMIKEDFQFHFNKLFAPYVMKGETSVDFPSSVSKYTSLWILQWSQYFDHKYSGFKTPLKNIDFDMLEAESNTLLKAFGKDTNIEQLQLIKHNVLKNFSYAQEDRYEIALKNTIFNMGLMKHFKHQGIEAEISKTLQCYYASFDNKSNKIYQNYHFGKGIEEIRVQKLKEFSPKTENDFKMLLFLSTNRALFKQGFNNSLGLRDDKGEMDVAELFHQLIIKENHDKLDSDLPHKITGKKQNSKKI